MASSCRLKNIESSQTSAWVGPKPRAATGSAVSFCRWRRPGSKRPRMRRIVKGAKPWLATGYNGRLTPQRRDHCQAGRPSHDCDLRKRRDATPASRLGSYSEVRKGASQLSRPFCARRALRFTAALASFHAAQRRTLSPREVKDNDLRSESRSTP
jgi:hypothetical protein